MKDFDIIGSETFRNSPAAPKKAQTVAQLQAIVTARKAWVNAARAKGWSKEAREHEKKLRAALAALENAA